MRNPLCLIKSIWRSIRVSDMVAGCDYVEETVERGCTVQVLKCKCCGKISVAWSKP